MKTDDGRARSQSTESGVSVPKSPACDRALRLIQTLVQNADWWSSAIELGYNIDGEGLYDEAVDILQSAGLSTELL